METSGQITQDELIVLNNGLVVRKVSAWGEVDGQQRRMTFLTTNRNWSSQTICDLYKVRWQVWMALLFYLFLRFVSRMSS